MQCRPLDCPFGAGGHNFYDSSVVTCSESHRYTRNGQIVWQRRQGSAPFCLMYCHYLNARSLLLISPQLQRHSEPPRSLEINDIITPSRDTPALRSSADHQSRHLDMDAVVPKCLNFSDVSCSTDSTDDTATTVSLHASDISDDPKEIWTALGLTALHTPVPPRRRCRFNTPSTEASSPFQWDSDRLLISSGWHTPVSDSD